MNTENFSQKEIFDFDIFYNNLTQKEKYYFNKVDEYFSECDTETIDVVVKIINGESFISLRILDWFVTKYADKYKTKYKNKTDDDNSFFNVHNSYEAQLRSFKKQYFDPFRRSCKFWYNYDKNVKTKVIYTTIGQLNFFRWAIEHDVIEYIAYNYDSIIKSMNYFNKESKHNRLNKVNNLSDSNSTTSKSSCIKISISDSQSVGDNDSVIISFD